ncbi:hypothetical protein D9V41_11670 [Aeromicrobium phragmitis]|uniref:Uncharacterized protein n=1 Tax=Aeromicrobium phragmitis TaxID=2478914 RepID=A0A3L8PJ77_9ACTN|nr:hypothetical protein [Aeromicrobium phragmitis]RLV55407.1 hypothetical protein D9V41_11670 [Aeromicrobium phragmitis]
MPSSVDVVVLGVAAVLAVVALVAALVALRAVREVKALRASTAPVRASGEPEQHGGQDLEVRPAEASLVAPASAPEARIIEGRVIVPPTQEQLVAAQMTRPSVRIAIVVAGVMHALRPESRDRIGGLMRREYRQRRRARQRAARRAARVAPPPPGQTDGWMSS